MKKIVPMMFTSIGAVIGGLYGFLTMTATIPALIASDIPIPTDFIGTYQDRFFYVLLPVTLVVGWWVGKWRAAQTEELVGWRKWVALVLLGLIVAVLAYAASIALFFLTV